MTDFEIQSITILQKRGMGYKKISTITGYPLNNVKSHISRNPVEPEDVCMQCGVKLEQKAHHRTKMFCSRRCKSKWWYSHPHMMKKQTLNNFVCPVCGKAFSDYGKRIYCSVPCYAVARRKKNG